MVGKALENGTVHNASITSADAINAFPTLLQGTNESQRIGNRIRVKTMHINGAVAINDYGEGVLPPLTVKVFVLQPVGNRDASNLSASASYLPQLLDQGDGTSVDFDGSTVRSLYPINKDCYRVLATKTMKLGWATNENTKVLSARYSLKVPCPKTIIYDDVSNQAPNNFAPIFVLGWSRDDGVGTPGPSDIWVRNTCFATVYFTDA